MAKRKTSKAEPPVSRVTLEDMEHVRAVLDSLGKVAETEWRKSQRHLDDRGKAMQRIPCVIPEDLLAFLDYLRREPVLLWPDGRDLWVDLNRMDAIYEALRDAYRQGCEQGYIEGRVVELASRRQVSDTLNRVRRELPVKVQEKGSDGKLVTRELDMSMDERDEIIFTELPELKRRHGAEDAESTMAKRFGISDRQVRNINREQSVLREYLALVPMLGEGAASQRVLDKHGVNEKTGKPDEKRRAAIEKILAKLRLRSLPETP